MTACRGICRHTDDGTVEYSELYYRCNRVLADLFYSDDLTKRQLEFPKKRQRCKTQTEVTRYVQSRASSTDRTKLMKLPVFMYNAAPETDVLDEFKEKVGGCSLLLGRPEQPFRTGLCSAADVFF